jgi:WD40 repeat protein/tRNA A-37 threonylcarbamoyl transferase component Bud32
MTPETTDIDIERRALEAFARLCAMPEAQRAAARDEACGGNAELRRRVERLLAADGDARAPLAADKAIDGFMARQIREIAPASSVSEALNESSDVDGQYTILRVIGEGGMGTVYEAEQRHPRRRVAIKAIRPGRITPQMRKRFEYEAQILARLEHRGIARLYESNTQVEGNRIRAYLAMELVHGVPIDAYAEKNGLTLDARLRLLIEVCDAVAHAHRVGVIHRDLKPANILVNARGEPKVLDFGVARSIDGEETRATILTQHGEIIGTLAYMSPEQVEGRADADTRADVYSIGVVAYKVLTGALPIDVSGVGLVEAGRRILNDVPRPLGQFDRRLRGDLQLIVNRALEKDPARRYSSVDQLRDELARYLAGRPIESRGDSRFYVLRKALWRHRVAVGFVLLLLALLTAFGVVASVQAGRNRRLAISAETARQAATASEARATERAETLRRLLYFSNIGFAQSALEDNDLERAHTLLDGCDPALRDWEWSYLQRLSDRSSATLDLHIDRPRYADFTKDRTLVALATLEREAVLLRGIDVAGIATSEIFRQRLPAGAARAAVSADGKWFAFGGVVDGVTLVNLATSQRITLGQKSQDQVPQPGAAQLDTPRDDKPQPQRAPDRPLRVLAFTEDSASLIVGGVDQQLHVWDVAAHALRRTIPLAGDALPVCMTVSHAGDHWAAVGDVKGGIRLFDLRSGALLHALAGHDAPVWSLVLSPDGKRLASGDNDGRAIVWDLASVTPIVRADASAGWITAMCFSPDQSRLALGRADSTVRLLRLADASIVGVLRGHRHAVVHVDWQPDDTLHTISLDGSAKTWHAGSALDVPTIQTAQPESIGLAFDPAGARVIVGGGDGTVRTWSLAGASSSASAPPVAGPTLAAHGGPVLEVAVDAARGRIATAGRDGVVRVTRANADAPPLIISPDAGSISAIDFSPDGSRLIVGADRQIAMWDVAAGSMLHDYSAPGIIANEIIFDRAGAHFYAACTDGRVRCWDVRAAARPIREAMIDPHGLYDLQLSPDGRTLIVAGDTQTVALLDAQTLAPLKRYTGHSGGVLAVAYHPAGGRIASGGTDGTIRIWDVTSGAELISLRGHRRRIQHLAFSPDGATLASSSDDGTVKLWQTTPPAPRASADRVLAP